MTPLAVVQLITAIAQAFGLVVEDVLAFSCQKCPELRGPLHDEGGDMDRAREEALKRTKE